MSRVCWKWSLIDPFPLIAPKYGNKLISCQLAVAFNKTCLNILYILCNNWVGFTRAYGNKMLHQCREIKLAKKLLLHTGKSFRKLIKSTRNQILFTIFRLIRNQTDDF